MASDRARSPRSTDAAGSVLAELVVALGDRSSEIVVIGGMAAPRLGRGAAVPHEGTTDIDVLIEVAMDFDLEDEDYAWLEQGLLAIGAAPVQPGGYWRWRCRDVTIDLLCDRFPAEQHGLALDLPGAGLVTVMTLLGPAAARMDSHREPVDPAIPGSPTVRVAGLGGYLLAKSGAAAFRDTERDLYDFWWVVLQTDGGPQAAAAALQLPHLRPYLRRQHLALIDVIGDGAAAGRGAEIYADTMLRLGSPDSRDTLIEDVVTAASILMNELRRNN